MLCFQTVNGPALLGRTSIVIWIIRKYNFSILIRFWGHFRVIFDPDKSVIIVEGHFEVIFRPRESAWRQLNGL